jgi:uncharacterized protein (TIGR00295 family)
LSTIPSEAECISILVEEGCPPRVIRHTCTVMALAVAIAQRCHVNPDLARAGAQLHDVGRSRTHGIRHGVEGASIARSRHLPDELVLIIQKHMGAGFTAQEAKALGLPPGDYMPSTIEEKIVCHSDKLVGDHEFITSQQAYRELVEKGYRSTGDRMLEMHRELSSLCGIDIDDLTSTIDLKRVTSPCSKYLTGL